MRDNAGTDCVRAYKPRTALHFVGFRGDEFNRAKRVFGTPDFIHLGWDRRARREIDFTADTIVFTTGPHDQPFAARNFDDIKEPPCLTP